MRFDHLKNPAACAAKESSRYAINGVAVLLHQSRPYLCATDGRMVSAIPCELAADDKPHGVYPAAAFSEYRKRARKLWAEMDVNGTARVRSPEGVAEFPAEDSRFPDAFEVIPKAAPKAHRITIDARRLAMLADAFGTDAVTLHLAMDGDGIDDGLPIRVEPCYLGDAKNSRGKRIRAEIDGAMGAIMPIAAEKESK